MRGFKVRAGLGLTLVLVVVGAVVAQGVSGERAALSACREAMADRDYAGAAQRLAAFLDRYRTGERAEEASILRVRALIGKRDYEAALMAGRTFLSSFPDSTWERKARFLMGEAFARMRGFPDAARIYREQVDFLGGDSHERKIAGYYLSLARKAYEGEEQPDEFGRMKLVKDYGRALGYYGKARAIRVPEGEEAKISHRIADCRFHLNRFGPALAEWDELLKEHPESEQAAAATYFSGVCLVRLNRLSEARTRLRQVREKWGDSEFAPLSLIELGSTHRPLSTKDEKELARGLGYLKEFMRLYPSHEKAEEVAYSIGDAEYRFGRYDAAIAELRAFLAAFPEGEKSPLAQNQIAWSFFRKHDFDRATAEWKVFLGRWPNHELWTKVQGMIAGSAFAKGRWPLHLADKAEEVDRAPYLTSAERGFKGFLAAFPVHAQAGEAQYFLGEIHHRRKDYPAAITEWGVAASKYAGTKWASAAMFRVGSVYEKDLGDLPKAIAEYEKLVRRYPASGEARAVSQLLAQFREKHLEVVTERVYRTDETLKLRIRSRNVEDLEIRAWRIDAEEIFRRKLTLGGIESIVVDVVKPELTTTVATASYEKFRLFDREVPLALTGPGAWIVTLEDEDLTATTLVLISDLAIVTKQARGQALVFAANERTGKTVAGADVLLAVGGKVLGAGVTGSEGVLLFDSKALRGDVKVFATSGGHVAFTGVSVSGGTTFGYSTKAYLYTDRPLYRPGHEVKLKGIYRRVASGSYTVSAGETLEVEVRDPRDTVVYSEKLTTNEFGTISDSLYLPPTAAVGSYRIIAKDKKRRTFTGAFTVREYKKPEFTIDARSERRTYLPGEEVKVSVALRYFFGGPVPNAKVRYRLAVGPYSFDPSVHEEFAWFTMDPARERERKRREAMGMAAWKEGEVVTDADGNAEFSFKSRDRDEDLRYLVVLEALDLNRQWVRDAASVVVTRDGYFALAKTEKKVYRPGEEISVRLTTVDAVHFPVSVTGELVVARRTFEGNRETESIVSRKPAKTGEDGRVTIGVKVVRPGEYRLKFVGKDRRGGLVTGGTVVTIAGEAEDLGRHAKVVASRQIYREGEVAEVLVNSPVAPAWALLTFEGERVLDYKVVHLMDRSTTLRLLMKPMYSPNVFVKIAIPKGRELHEAEDEIYVFKYLDVSVAADRPEAKPGEEVSFTIRTADQRGKPVPAEVSLALVDRAILALESDAAAQMKPFFYDQRRTLAVTTGSSYSFRYTGVTRPTNQDLLWEDMRKRGAEKFTRAEKYVRAGREHLARKDYESAVIEFRKALQVLPEHYAARALLDRAQAELLVRRELAELQRHADMEPAEEMEQELALKEGKSVRGFAARGGGGGRYRVDRLRNKAGDKNAPMPSPATSPPSPDAAADEPAAGDYYLGAKLRRFGGKSQDAKLTFGYVSDFDVEIAQAAQIGDPVLFVPPTLRKRFADTAAWEPHVVTGADGKATVKVELPDNLTTWRAVVRGVTKATLVGEATGELTARKDVMVRVDTPRFLTQRDTVTVTQTVHNNAGRALPVRVSFEGTNVGLGETRPVTVTLSPSEIRVFDHVLSADDSGLARLTATAESQVASDAAKSGLPILPHGLMTLVGRSGEVGEEAYESFTLPDGVLPGTKDCWITLSPGIDASVLESLIYLGGFPYGCLEQTVNRFLPAIAADRALREVGSPNALVKERVRKAVEQGLLALYAFQNQDGSFGWFSGSVRRIGLGDRKRPAPRTDATMTALAILGIEEARLAGYRVSAKHRAAALGAGKRMVKTTGDRDEKSLLLFALSRGRAASLEDLNQLYRYRDSLSPRALSLLALAMSETGRGYNAVALVRLLTAQAVEKDGTVHFTGGGVVSDVEATAWAIRALYRVTPESPRAGDAVKWLMRNKRGPKWRSTRDTGAAILALADHLVKQGVSRADYVVEVWLNDGEVPYQKIRVAGGRIADDQRRFVKIDGARLKTGNNQLKLVKRGPGSLFYTLKLTYFTAADRIEAAGNLVSVARRYAEYVSPVAVKEGVKEIAPGWTIVRPEARPKEDTSQTIDRAGSGDKFRIRLTLEARDDLSYVIVTDPLPAGVEVVEGQSTGAFDWEERRDEKQVFFLSNVPKGKKVELSYLVQAIHPGRFHALPTMAYPMYEPAIWGRAAEQVLTILPESGVVGRPSAEEGITPDEMYGLAVRDFREERFDAAKKALARLVVAFKLEDKYLEECQAMLMRCAFEAGDSRGAVEAYERLRELNPRRGPRTTVERKSLASAYQGIGEYERALSLFRGVTDEYLVRELAVAETYRGLGNPYRAQDFVTELLRGYPDSNGAVDQAYRLGQRYLEMKVPEDPKEKRSKPPGVDTGLMLPEALHAFRAFVSHYPESSLADEASRMSVTVLNRMEVPSEAVAEARRFIRRYPDSAHTDDVLYYLAESYFEEGKYEQVFETGRRILTGRFRLRSGRRETGPSPFVPHVKYLFAKILHLQDELTRAVELYRQVKDEFEDAADVLAYLTRKELVVPETAEFGVGESASLKIRLKNVTDLTVRIYPVDLMLLIAVKKDLRKANEIDLTGIATKRNVKRSFPNGVNHRFSEQEVPLGVTEKGVYLVVVKAGDLIETSIVIVSNLSISVQTTNDAVRVYATDRRTGKPVKAVFVKISDGGQIRAQGFTDARGVFEGRKVSGPVMVVAEKEGDSALYRR